MKYEKSMLLETIGDTVENRILDFMIEGKGFEYSKKDIAEGCGISRPTVYKVLPDMIKEKIILSTKKIGRIELYSINPESEKVRRLMKLEAVLLNESFPAEKQIAVVRCQTCNQVI